MRATAARLNASGKRSGRRARRWATGATARRTAIAAVEEKRLVAAGAVICILSTFPYGLCSAGELAGFRWA